jgi:sugar-specific transcriptional regulator TrmB
MASASAKFNRAIEGLPHEVQLHLLKKHVVALLDNAPKTSTKKVLQHVNKTRQRYASMPKILYRDRREEVQNLLDQIEQDQKKYGGAPEFMSTDTSHTWAEGGTRREELLEEVVQSILEWLQVIWSVVYEYNAHFSEAHASLLYCTKAVLDLVESPTRCKCATSNIPIKVNFRRNHSKPGQIVKRFSMTGIEQIHRIIFWVWREMMVSAMGNNITVSIAHYLSDIEQMLGWRSLEKVLTGGRRGSPSFCLWACC